MNSCGAGSFTRTFTATDDAGLVNVIPNNTAGTGDDQAFMTLFTNRVLSPSAPQRDREFFGYAGSNSRGFFRYTQFIKIYDEVAPEITYTELDECFAGAGEGCRTTVTIEFTALDECSAITVGVELDANYVVDNFNADNAAALGIGVSVENDGNGNYAVTVTNVPVGEHALRVRANGIGNGLGLAFNTELAPATAQNVLHQNTPNPVHLETVIRFELAPATLTLRDAAGRLISVQEIDATAGLNTVELTNIKTSGVLTYTLTAGAFTASKKMVVVQ
jgi:hypothetical protein